MRALGIQTPCIEVPNGFLAAEAPRAKSLTWSESGPIRLFFFGRLDYLGKGLDLLLGALFDISQRYAVSLTLQGPDVQDGREKIQRQSAKYGITSLVTILEPDYTSAPTVILAKYDIVCLASRFEGFSLSMLEAMLAARPVVVTRDVGVARHVEQSGCGIVSEATATSLALAIETLIKRRQSWPSIGMAGYEYAKQHLEWNEIARSALEQYKGILAKQSG
jgi:glycosyltransferase involved in cell wall biosynthesis